MLFEVRMEVKDSAVTLSAALAKYMVRHNTTVALPAQGKEKELRVMPFKAFDTYGWDINPDTEETGLPREYVDQLEVLQWNDEERCVGFLMDHPNVVGLLVSYGMRDLIQESMDTGAPVRMMVRPRLWHGRMQYMLEQTRWEERSMQDRIELWWSRWIVKCIM